MDLMDVYQMSFQPIIKPNIHPEPFLGKTLKERCGPGWHMVPSLAWRVVLTKPNSVYWTVEGYMFLL